MGPTLIFDKSTLEGLNTDEAMWLDNFFLSNITPLFFIETLADLEKEVRRGRTPESVVGSLAHRTPDQSSKPNVHHRTLLEAELSGAAPIDMEHGRPHVAQVRSMALGQKTGVMLQQAPEEEALARWREMQFLELERLQAKAWRESLSNIDLEGTYRTYQAFFPIGKPKSLSDVRRIVNVHLDATDQEQVLIFGLSVLGAAPTFQAQILNRWRKIGKPPITSFAPYFRHVISVDLFFNLAIAADLIGRGRPSHKIDVAYLYYLPFCKVFTSNDRLHADIVPIFLRADQTFVLGTDLKEDLGKLDQYYDALPSEVKDRGVMSFAHRPPDDTTFLVTRLWDKHMSPRWRGAATPTPQPDSEIGRRLKEEIRHMVEEGKPLPPGSHVDGDKADFMIVKRLVRARMGKWERFPPEVRNRRRNAQGEWEDTSNANL